MMPRLKTGKGATGCIRYVLGEGRDPKTGELLPHPLDGSSRVAWIGGTGFGFKIETRDDADLARRVMEFDALNQQSKTRKCEQDCVHLSLAWARGETPSREEMETAAHEALEAVGMKNAKALFVAHDDEDMAHVHIIASKINPDTGRAYDLDKSYRKLSKWALEYEREHGGVHLKGREDMNDLRDAIARRDAVGVLEAMTRQRATFTGKELERALQKEIYAPRGADAGEKRSVELARAQFADKILDHADCVHLAKEPGGPTTRYTTRSVLEAEGYVMRAAEGLAANKTHGLTEDQRFATLNSAQHDGISREQARAFRHATGEEGLAIIDGLAGAGKSRTTNAVREAYEAAGYRVIGTAWTHKVVQDMEAKGFENTSTVKRELFMLANGREQWDSKTVVIIDEAAMLDTAHMAMMTSYANESGAKLILVGDDRQLASIERGGMFGVLKDRFGAATLTEINRQVSGDDRRASEYFAEGKFHDALGIYQQKDGIHWTRTQGEARAELLDTYRQDVTAAPDKSRFIFAYTNIDCAELNKGAREVHRQLGQLGKDHELDTIDGRMAFAAGDRIQFNKTDKKLGLFNGSVGTVKHIENGRVFAEIDGKVIGFDNAQYQSFRHGYAGTIYKGQGATVDQSYLYHSEHWRSAASYVGMTRHREKAELFAATNTAENIDQLARQMSRVDEGKRYAASMYHHRQQIDPVRPLTAEEVVARFADQTFRREQQQQPAQEYRRAHVIEQTAAEMRGARKARPLDRQQRRPNQQKQDGKMDNELDEEEQRRRHRNAGVGTIIDLESLRQEKAANDHPQWSRTEDGSWEMTVGGERVAALLPNNEPDHPNGWLSNGVGTKDLPEHGWDNVDFGSLEQGKQTLEKWWDHAVRGEAYQPERPERPQVTHEAIERDPWNAVALDLPIKIGETDSALLLQVAETARDLRFALGERAEQAVTPGQQELWQDHAERAEARQKLAETLFLIQAHDQPMTVESIDYDPWAAVYQPIPANADAALLQKAHDAAMQCAGAVAGEPGPTIHAYEPTLFGKDQDLTREVNFQNAVQRIDELDTRLRAAERQQQPETELQQPEPSTRLEQPFAEREGRPFSPSEQRPDRYDELRTEVTTEPVTREAGDEPDVVLQAMRAEREANGSPEAREPMTFETINADRWTAVDLPIPENADALLLNNASFAAMRCFNERQAPDGVSPEEWEDRRAAAGERVKELAGRIDDLLPSLDPAGPISRDDLISCLDHADVVNAWQAPAFSFETISADPWTAVYLPIPQDADPELLTHAASWARDLEQYAARDGASAGPFVDQPPDAPELQTAARERGAELGERIELARAADPSAEPEQSDKAKLDAETREAGDEPDIVLQAMRAERETKESEAREPVTLEAIERDPWNAIILDLPKDASPELYAAVAETAQNLLDTPDNELPPAPFLLPRSDEEWADLGAMIKTRLRDAQHEILIREAGDEPDIVLQAMRAEREGKEPEARGPVTRDVGDEPDIVLQAMRAEREGKEPEAREPVTREAGDEPDIVLQAMRAERAAKEPKAPQSMTLDDIAERVQQIIDNPELAADEHNDVVLQAMRARLDGGEFARPDQDYDPRRVQAEQQQSDDTRSRTAADDQPDVKHDGNNARAREQEQERDGEGEEEHTLEQGGGGRERSLQ